MRRVLISAAKACVCPVEAAIRPPALRVERADNDACDLVEPQTAAFRGRYGRPR